MAHTAETRRTAWLKMKAKRDAWISENGPCSHCGSFDRLEVHHVDPMLKVSHNVWSWRESRRIEELSKCIPLCRECHQKETGKQFSKGVVHGTSLAYSKGCRCRPCTDASTAKRRNSRIKKWGVNSSRMPNYMK